MQSVSKIDLLKFPIFPFSESGRKIAKKSRDKIIVHMLFRAYLYYNPYSLICVLGFLLDKDLAGTVHR